MLSHPGWQLFTVLWLLFLNSGDHVLSCQSIFGSTHTLFTKYFPKWNINTTYFKANEVNDIEKYITPGTKILYAETPTNPAIEILDLEVLGQIAKKHNLIFIVDNCFATPYLQQPIKYGADLVVHSATKLIDGQGRVLGGVVVGKADLVREIYLLQEIQDHHFLHSMHGCYPKVWKHWRFA